MNKNPANRILERKRLVEFHRLRAKDVSLSMRQREFHSIQSRLIRQTMKREAKPIFNWRALCTFWRERLITFSLRKKQ